MKTPVRIILAILLFVPACNRNTPSTTRAASEQGAPSNTDLQRQRDEYVKTVEAKLKEFDQKIDGLEARGSQMKEPEKKNFTNAIDQLKEQRKTVVRKLDDLKKVNVESWTNMKGSVDSALSELERSYQTVSSKYESTPATTSKTRT